MELFQPSAMALNERTIPGQLGRPFPNAVDGSPAREVWPVFTPLRLSMSAPARVAQEEDL